MPQVTGVLETALYVEDLPLSVRFYKEIFDFEIFASDERLCIMIVPGRQILLLFKKGASLLPVETPGGTIPPNDGDGQLHLAFSISAADFEPWEKKLGEHGVPIESKVVWQMGGRSLYFRDPDQHLLELVTPGTWPVY